MLRLFVFMSIFFAFDGYCSFYEQKEKGWYWHEQRTIPKEARSEKIDSRVFKKQLEDLRFSTYNTAFAGDIKDLVEKIKALREMELKMFSAGENLMKGYEIAYLKYPHLDDKLSDPTTVDAVRIERALKAKELKGVVQKFAQEFDFVLFRKSTCPYSQEFEKVLKAFSDDFNAMVEAVSVDGTSSNLFSNKSAPALASILGVNETPTLFVIHKKNNNFFELSRGLISYDQLKEKIIQATEKEKIYEAHN